MTKSLAECMTLTQNQYVCFHLCRPCICNRQPGCASWMLSDYTYASLFTLCGENSVWCCQRNSLRLLSTLTVRPCKNTRQDRSRSSSNSIH